VSDAANPDPSATGAASTEQLMRWATYASVAVATTLISAKFAAWIVTDSVSLFATLIDSLLDAAASVINLLAVRHALQPADREHRFGHGKAEPLAGLAQAAFITGSAAFLLIEAGERFFHPRELTNTATGYSVMVFSIVLTVALVAFQRYVVRRSGSLAISADSLHYQTDVIINASVMVSLFLTSQLGWTLADPVFALGIAAYIIRAAWKIGTDACNILMDHELPDADRQRIKSIVLGHPDVLGLHDLRTRSTGTHVFIQLHLEMDGEITLSKAHTISDQVELSVLEAFPNAEVIVHEDPEGLDEPRRDFA
jgi:ferrous-iron efflux pump FieF